MFPSFTLLHVPVRRTTLAFDASVELHRSKISYIQQQQSAITSPFRVAHTALKVHTFRSQVNFAKMLQAFASRPLHPCLCYQHPVVASVQIAPFAREQTFVIHRSKGYLIHGLLGCRRLDAQKAQMKGPRQESTIHGFLVENVKVNTTL